MGSSFAKEQCALSILIFPMAVSSCPGQPRRHNSTAAPYYTQPVYTSGKHASSAVCRAHLARPTFANRSTLEP
eukprot:314237-Prorocentrum_minimum.AAC.1